MLAARGVLAAMGEKDRAGALEQVRAVSPGLAKLLSTATQAVQLSRRSAHQDGYLVFPTRPEIAANSASEGAVDPGALPLGVSTVHELRAEDVLSSVPHDRAGAVLLEWARVLCDGGLLRLEVPNIEAVPEMLAAGASAELRRALFGGRRFGEDGAGEANADAWSAAELEASLKGVGLLIEEMNSDTSIVVSARRTAVVSRCPASGVVPPVCVLVTAACGAEDLLSRFASFLRPSQELTSRP